MDYEISVSEAEELVHIKVYETVTSDIEHAFVTAAIYTATEHDLLHFLFDVSRVRNVATPVDHYCVANQQLTPTPLDHRARIAILRSPEDDSHDFVQTVLLNAGYICELFHDEVDARAWLDA